MNYFEMLEKLNKQYYDEFYRRDFDYERDAFGNIYVYDSLIPLCDELGDYLGDYIFIDAATAARLESINIIVDEETLHWKSFVKYPYYRLRGKRVTSEQAFEVIWRTDSFYDDLYIAWNSLPRKCPNRNKIKRDHIRLVNFKNEWLSSEHNGWIRPSGILGCNGLIDKYPDFTEIFTDIMNISFSFPYLDFTVGIEEWDEGIVYCWEDDKIIHIHMDDKYFDDKSVFAVSLGARVSGNEIRFAVYDEATEMYDEYERLYEEDKQIYKTKYYRDTNINEVPEGYLERFIEANGLIPEVMLEKIPRRIWEG